MRKPYLIIIAMAMLALAAAPPYSSAQQRQQALPVNFARWSRIFDASDMHTMELPHSADMLKEAGLTGLESSDYSSGDAKIHVDLEKYHDPSSAYEIYTALIRPDMHPSTLDRTSAVEGDKLLVLVGNCILKVQPTPAISTADLTTLVKSVSAHSDKTPLPPIRTFLPGGFVDGSQKYALGPEGFRSALTALNRDEFSVLVNEAGFNSGAEAMFARYASGKGDGVLLLIDYPTPQLAEQHLRHLNQALPPAAAQTGTTIERDGTLLTVVLRPSSASYATWLRREVAHETAVTWNEPTHTITDPPLLGTVAKIIVSTLVFMLVAVVLGVAFGGIRVLAKVFFPGKIFDRPEQMDVLQLGLNSKQINSRDFY